MSVTHTLYTSYKQYVHDGTIDLDAANIYIALLDDTYTFSAAHTILANTTGELAAGTGYATGGAQLASLSVNSSRWDAADVTWAFTGNKTFKWGVIYVNATVNSIVKPLISCILFDDTPASITIASHDFSIQWHSNGLITF